MLTLVLRTVLVLASPGCARALHIAITGTNSGIGASAAKLLLGEGHTVYHACRTQAGAREAVAQAGGGVPMVCDLADLDSVRTFSSALAERAPGLDVLCLNAGVSPSRTATVPARTKDGFERTVGVNHLGHYALAQARQWRVIASHCPSLIAIQSPQLLRPLLAANSGRVVVTASGVHDPASPGGTVQVIMIIITVMIIYSYYS